MDDIHIQAQNLRWMKIFHPLRFLGGGKSKRKKIRGRKKVQEKFRGMKEGFRGVKDQIQGDDKNLQKLPKIIINGKILLKNDKLSFFVLLAKYSGG